MTIHDGTSTRPTERNDIVGIANEVASEKHGGSKYCKNPKVTVITWNNSVDDNSQKERNSVDVQQQSNLIPSNVVNVVDNDRCNDDNNVDNDDDDEMDRIAKLNADAAAEAIIYLQTKEQRWEMTWPIWHMLPRHERKDIAIQYGYKTIGEFEEYMSLRQAFGDSSAIIHNQDDLQQSSSSQQQIRSSSSSTIKHPYPNQLLYGHDSKLSSSQQTNDNLKRTNIEDEEETDNNLECQLIEKELDMEKEHEIISSIDQNLSSIELIKVGGIILLIPEDILHKVFAWLPADTYATLALVSKHWKYFTRTEHVYKRLCERLYLIQSKRKVLHVHKFHNSYRTMLEVRPRVRAGGGVYVMKYSEIRRIQRDMWTEVCILYIYHLFYIIPNGFIVHTICCYCSWLSMLFLLH